MKHFIICYDSAPLVLVKDVQYQMPSDVLDWYAENYAFERRRLTWCGICEVEGPNENKEPS